MSSTNGAKPRGHQALNAGRLCRDRDRSGLVRPPQCIPQSTRMHSTTAAPRSSRRSLLSWCATTKSVTSSRGRPIGSSPSTGGKPTATSTRGPGAGLLCRPAPAGVTLASLLNIDDIDNGLLLLTFVHWVDDQGSPLFGTGRDQRARRSRARRTRISRPSSTPCVNTGCRSVSTREGLLATPASNLVRPTPICRIRPKRSDPFDAWVARQGLDSPARRAWQTRFWRIPDNYCSGNKPIRVEPNRLIVATPTQAPSELAAKSTGLDERPGIQS